MNYYAILLMMISSPYAWAALVIALCAFGYANYRLRALEDKSLKNNPVIQATRSGLIDPGQVTQSVVLRGTIDNESNNFESPIQSGFFEGITKKPQLDTAEYAARKARIQSGQQASDAAIAENETAYRGVSGRRQMPIRSMGESETRMVSGAMSGISPDFMRELLESRRPKKLTEKRGFWISIMVISLLFIFAFITVPMLCTFTALTTYCP